MSNIKEVQNLELKAVKKRLDALAKGKWSILQVYLQEIQANDLVTEVLENKESKVALTKQIKILKERISLEFEEDLEVGQLIMETFPPYYTIRRWVKTQVWQEAVYGRIKYGHLFDNITKTKIIRGIINKATAPGREDMKASELYFKIYENVFAKKDEKGKNDTLSELQSIVSGKKAK